METTIKSHTASGSENTELSKTASALSAFLNDLEAYRFAIAPMLLTAMVCLGGIAAGFAAQISEPQLLAVAMSTVLIEVLVLALVPMRLIFWASVTALLIDLFVFIF